MRADRLVAVLLLLQQRGTVTAAEVAEELEVSERTARRDLEALGMAGIPVYSQQGRNGGWRLAGGGRIDLSGLNADEARALFMVAGPEAATPEVKAALRKLVRALPEPLRVRAEAAAGSVVLDDRGWDGRPVRRPPPPHLPRVQQAVVEAERIRLDYVARDGSSSSRVVDPLGVASKAGTWYLVASTDAGLRTFRVDRMQAVAPTGERADRPPGFDLDEAWRLISDEVDRKRLPVQFRGLADPGSAPLLQAVLGDRVRIGPPVDGDGRIDVEIRGHSVYALAREIAGFGRLLEIVDPPEARAELAAVGRELDEIYGATTSPGRRRRTRSAS